MAHETDDMPPPWLAGATEIMLTEDDNDYIIIDGERIDNPLDVSIDDENRARITDGEQEWLLFSSVEDAGEAAREYYEHLADYECDELACLIGVETLIQWGLGQMAGPGTTKVSSLSKWMDLFQENPEEHFACDQKECKVNEIGTDLEEELGFKPTIAYRLS
jgi:hypothetical protein